VGEKQTKEAVKMLRTFYRKITKKFRITNIFLVGSCARGEALKSHSDIDAIVISDDFKDMKPIFRIRELVKFWDWSTGIDLIPLTKEEFERKKKGINILSAMMKEGYIKIV